MRVSHNRRPEARGAPSSDKGSLGTYIQGAAIFQVSPSLVCIHACPGMQPVPLSLYACISASFASPVLQLATCAANYLGP